MSVETLGLGALAVALLAGFVMLEGRLRHPLIRLGIFRMRSITGANAAMLLVAGGMFAMFFFASIYVQEVLGYSALRAGLAFLPVTAGHHRRRGALAAVDPPGRRSCRGVGRHVDRGTRTHRPEPDSGGGARTSVICCPG